MSDAEEVLNEILKKVGKEQGYENPQISAKAISTGGANYTSFLYLATVSSPDKDDLKLFVKVAAVGEKMRSVAPFKLFEIESFGYKKLLQAYKQLEETHNVPAEHRLVTPTFYGSSEEYLREALVLEDLASSGYSQFDRFKSFDWEYASKGVQNLAKLHALSIAWSIESPEEFEKTESMKIDLDGMAEYMKTIVANALQVTREENKERLSKFMETLIDDKESMAAYYKPIRRPVVAHGDYRASNLMHRVKEDGTVDIISVDYQTLQQACPMLDLMYFIFTGSDKQFRTQHYSATVQHYYSELCAALRRLDLDPDQLYSREDFEYEFQRMLPVGLTSAMFCLLLVCVDERDAPTVSSELGMDDFVINPSSLYKERLNDIVDDFIAMGVI